MSRKMTRPIKHEYQNVKETKMEEREQYACCCCRFWQWVDSHQLLWYEQLQVAKSYFLFIFNYFFATQSFVNCSEYSVLFERFYFTIFYITHFPHFYGSAHLPVIDVCFGGCIIVCLCVNVQPGRAVIWLACWWLFFIKLTTFAIFCTMIVA